MPLSQWLFSLDGRIGRDRYFLATFLYAIAAAVLVIAAVLATDPSMPPSLQFLLILLVYFLAGVPIIVKRFHDRGKSGWWYLLSLVLLLFGNLLAASSGNPQVPNPLGRLVMLGVTTWLLLDLFILPGDPGANRYGESPKHLFTVRRDIVDLATSFKGRVCRGEYWLGSIFSTFYFNVATMTAVLLALVIVIAGIPAGLPVRSLVLGVTYLALGLALLAGLYTGLALAVRRCHDRGRSGWFLLLLLIPLVNLWPLIELAFIRGEAGANRFGPDPLAEAVS